MNVQLHFRIPCITCSCGTVYFKGQEDMMWQCVQRHIDDKNTLDYFQGLFERMNEDD